ncbi:hypothetical protein PoB_005402800 [Plakobranchus ocellatus]|uniref:Uncharacterized protein n=1 Tax=Plakobranchus ocellatus TaxID=259542 RepID=A0AAV4C949_9GAST|nr:hypothetical protein PoB_005402800 [Plakobranchus ocellatus]
MPFPQTPFAEPLPSVSFKTRACLFSYTPRCLANGELSLSEFSPDLNPFTVPQHGAGVQTSSSYLYQLIYSDWPLETSGLIIEAVPAVSKLNTTPT